ncbi:hypothetical protein ACWGR4_29190 [Embleya sp. NPDC055664]
MAIGRAADHEPDLDREFALFTRPLTRRVPPRSLVDAVFASHRSPGPELVRAQIDALMAMTTRISNHGLKLEHASQGDITTARTFVCTVESLLMSLFLERL